MGKSVTAPNRETDNEVYLCQLTVVVNHLEGVLYGAVYRTCTEAPMKQARDTPPISLLAGCSLEICGWTTLKSGQRGKAEQTRNLILTAICWTLPFVLWLCLQDSAPTSSGGHMNDGLHISVSLNTVSKQYETPDPVEVPRGISDTPVAREFKDWQG